MNNYCVCCGAIIPEGRQVCPACENKTYSTNCNGLYYSVYETGTDMPVVIHRKSQKAAKILGITQSSFLSKFHRQRHERTKKPRKFYIMVDVDQSDD